MDLNRMCHTAAWRNVRNVYDQNLAAVYDAVYGVAAGKDYAKEAGELAKLVRERRPQASSLLDVACGTGQHLLHLRELFAQVEGVELSPEMAAIARTRLGSTARVHVGDMRDFDLGRRYDAVTCLFSSIGYVESWEELRATLERFAAHLEPGGVLLLEPWFSPEAWQPGAVHHSSVQEGGRTVIRLSYSGLTEDGKSSTDMHYLYGQEGVGIRHWQDRHVMSLFTDDQYLDAFAEAGFAPVEEVPGWRAGRDRLVAILPGS
jgi:SAM-dependent methyltransferase